MKFSLRCAKVGSSIPRSSVERGVPASSYDSWRHEPCRNSLRMSAMPGSSSGSSLATFLSLMMCSVEPLGTMLSRARMM